MSQFIYNVTVKVDLEVQESWLQWMRQTHIPDVMATGFFTDFKICKLIGKGESDGVTYAIQYGFESMGELHKYRLSHAAALQAEHEKAFGGKYVAFRTLLEVLP